MTAVHVSMAWEGEMKIALYGATGMIGSRVGIEAARRDHIVTAISRGGGRPASPDDTSSGGRASEAALLAGAIRPRRGDAADADDVARVAAEHDVVVSAIGPSRIGARHQIFLHALSVLAENVGTRRLVVVGSAGSLQVAPGLRLMDTATFPAAYRPEAVTQAAALALLKDTSALLDWVYVSPAPAIGPGARSGRYRVGLEVPIGDWITAEDYAVALLDEIEVPRYHRIRINVAH